MYRVSRVLPAIRRNLLPLVSNGFQFRYSSNSCSRHSTDTCQSSTGSIVRTPMVRSLAPAFQTNALMPSGDIKSISSTDFNNTYWILFFYPLDFTFVCPTELLAFHEQSKKFEDIGCKLVGCSIDSEYSHLAWSKVPRSSGGLGSPLSFPLLADITKSIASNFGVLLPSGIALRGLFIIDPKGVVRHSTINDLPIGRSVDEVLRTVQAIQFVDKNGEVCPANWTPGSATIQPKQAEKYFQAKNK
jgi:alkyl hydroperoxide reductase subunit AhpC